MSKRRSAVRYIGAALTVAAIAFLILAFRRLDFSTLRAPAGAFPWGIALALSCCYALTVGVQGLAWRSTLSFLAPIKPPMARTLSVYARANIGKYLPGNVMHFVGRNFFGVSLGLAHQDMVIGTFIEIFALAATAFLSSFLCALASGTIGEYARILDIDRIMVFMSIAVFLVLGAALAASRVKKVKSAVVALHSKFSAALARTKDADSFRSFPKFVAGLFSLYLLNFLLNAGIVLICANMFLGIPFGYGISLKLSAAYIASWLAGFVVPGAPGGLGVREASFLLLAGTLIGQREALALAAVSRAICVAGDAIAFFSALPIQVPKSRQG